MCLRGRRNHSCVPFANWSVVYEYIVIVGAWNIFFVKSCNRFFSDVVSFISVCVCLLSLLSVPVLIFHLCFGMICIGFFFWLYNVYSLILFVGGFMSFFFLSMCKSLSFFSYVSMFLPSFISQKGSQYINLFLWLCHSVSLFCCN